MINNLKDIYKLRDKFKQFKALTLRAFYKFSILQDPNKNVRSKNLNRINRENRKKIKRFYLISFIFLLLIPFTFFSYYIYRTRYISSSKIVIRNSSNNNVIDSSIFSLLNSNSSGSFTETRYIKTYLHSPQVYKEIEKELNFSELYSKAGFDFLSGINLDMPLDKKLEFYKNNIILSLDSISGELEIKVIAFQPKTAYTLNKLLIKKSEKFINELNKKIFRTQLQLQNQEVLEAFKKVKDKQIRLTDFQNKNLLFDGYDALRANTTIINGLENELVKFKVELSTLKRKFIDQNTPEIIFLNNQIIELEKQINIEKNQMFSESGKKLNKKAFALKNLESDLEFSMDLYKSALTIQESARLGTIRQKHYIVKVIEPYISQKEYLFPKNKFYFTTLIFIFLTYYLSRFIFGIIDNYKN